MTNIKRVAGYGRVSSREQAEHGHSKDIQPERVKAMCEAQGWELVKFYDDFGISGKDVENRPGLQQLMTDAKAGKFDVVMFTALDRLGRDLRDLLNLSVAFKKYGVDMFCISPSLNTTDDTGKLIFHIFGALAEFERGVIGQRTQAGIKKAWEKGGLVGKAPFGYRRNEKTKHAEICPVTRPIYERIVSMYIDEGLRMEAIAAKLTSDKTLTPHVKNKLGKWNTTTLSRILNNSAYTGERISNQKDRKGNAKPESEWVTEKFPALITQERFNRILTMIQANKGKQKNFSKQHPDKFLALKTLRCGHCGAKIDDSIDNGGRNFYYMCYWSRTSKAALAHSDRNRCTLGCLNADDIDEQVFDQLLKIIANPGKYAEEWLKNADKEELSRKNGAWLADKEEISRKLRNVIKQTITVDDANSIKMYKEEREQLESELKNVEHQLAKLKPELDAAHSKMDWLADYQGRFKGLLLSARFKGILMSLPFHEKKRILEAIVQPERGGYIEVTKVEEEGSTFANLRFNFQLEPDRIKAIITGLNKSDLYHNEQRGDRCTINGNKGDTLRNEQPMNFR